MSRQKLPRKKLSRSSEAEIVGDGKDRFVILDGVNIAKRGQPGSVWIGQPSQSSNRLSALAYRYRSQDYKEA